MTEQSAPETTVPENPVPENPVSDNSVPETPAHDKTPPPKLSPEDQEIVDYISRALGEAQKVPVLLIQELVRVCGAEFAMDVLRETYRIEAHGGLMTNNTTRRRTTGGVFFYTARGRMTTEQETEVYAVQERMRGKGGNKSVFNYEKRTALFGKKAPGKGDAFEVRVTLIGRPGKVNQFRDLVIATMTHQATDPSLPAGLPSPPNERVIYTIYMSHNQWHKVEKQLKDPTKTLVVEGICAYDEQTESMAIYSTKVITRLQKERELKAGRPEQPENAVQQKVKPEAKPTIPRYGNKSNQNAKPNPDSAPSNESQSGGEQSNAAQSGSAPANSAPVIPVAEESDMPAVNIPESAPADEALKLRQLHTAAEQFRKKIASLEEMPESKRFGLDMTKKLLANTERQITELESKYK